jgi:hypothetical protein
MTINGSPGNQSMQKRILLWSISYSAGSAGLSLFRKHMMAKLCAAAILSSGGGVSAQTIYKQVDAAGRTLYTDRAVAEGIAMANARSPAQQPGPLSPSRIATGTRSDVAEALSSSSAMSSMYAATVDFNEASLRLRQAQQSRLDGVERRPGEWTDSADSATDKRYQKRQQRLGRAVEAAERRLHQTSVVRNAWLRTALERSDDRTDPLGSAQP